MQLRLLRLDLVKHRNDKNLPVMLDSFLNLNPSVVPFVEKVLVGVYRLEVGQPVQLFKGIHDMLIEVSTANVISF